MICREALCDDLKNQKFALLYDESLKQMFQQKLMEILYKEIQDKKCQ